MYYQTLGKLLRRTHLWLSTMLIVLLELKQAKICDPDASKVRIRVILT